ncbi:MAG: TldD/PmbA family protein [Ruminococcaceae bacterium]|nr:TldD/PmbA family protein [Oscillospiraceae bacterium]
MNFEKIREILFCEAKKAGLSEFDVYLRMEESHSAEALNREPSAFSSSKSGGVSLRVSVDGRLGAAATECFEEEELAALVSRALANARVTDADEEPIFYGDFTNTEYSKPTVEPMSIPTAAELRHTALALQEEMYGESELVTDGTTSETGASKVTVSIANAKGLSLSHTASMHYAYAKAIIRDGEEPSYGTANSTELDPALSGIAKKAVDEAKARLGAVNLQTGKYDVIFSAKQVRSLLSAYARIFSGKRALQGLSLLKGKEGEVVASPAVTLYDDPFYKDNPMQMPFDAEGVATYKKALIEGGVLKTLLYDLTYAKKAGVVSTGNAARGYADPVSISHFCLSLAAGELSFHDLLKRLGDGIYITEMKGLHSGADAVTGDFSIESAGFLVKNGQLAAPVHSFTVAGNFFDLLKAVDALSDRVETGLPGFSMIAAPDMLVRGLSCAGES